MVKAFANALAIRLNVAMFLFKFADYFVSKPLVKMGRFGIVLVHS